MWTNAKTEISVELMPNVLTLTEAMNASVGPDMKKLIPLQKVVVETQMNACSVDPRVGQIPNVLTLTAVINVSVRMGSLVTPLLAVNVSPNQMNLFDITLMEISFGSAL